MQFKKYEINLMKNNNVDNYKEKIINQANTICSNCSSDQVFKTGKRINKNQIVQRYKCHTGWVNIANPGGFRENNVNFILDFPCALINDM